jgi:hypothetical protein
MRWHSRRGRRARSPAGELRQPASGRRRSRRPSRQRPKISRRPARRACRPACASRYAPEERAWTEPAADLAEPSPGACGPTGQATDPQPGPHAGGSAELSPPGGPSRCGQHCQARCERGGHRLGPQPQQAQAHAHQRQQKHASTGTRRRDAAPAWFTTGSPTGGAHGARDEALAVPGPLPCLPLPGLGVVTIRWKTRPGGLAATECRARLARGVLPPPAVHPATRTAIAPNSAPARRDRAQTCEAVILPSLHGSGGIPLTYLGPDRFPPGAEEVLAEPHPGGPRSARWLPLRRSARRDQAASDGP